MKALFLAICAFGAISFSQNAQAALGADNYGSKGTCDSCTGNCHNCPVFNQNNYCETGVGGTWVSIGNCTGGGGVYAIKYGRNTSNTQMCCDWVEAFGRSEEEVLAEITQKTERLEEVFSAFQSPVYWGYYNATSRSPNNGRTTSAAARLDVCLDYSDVDALGTGYTAWDTCKTSTTAGCLAGSKNEYCQANSNAVCLDRCDCMFPGFDTCSNL